MGGVDLGISARYSTASAPAGGIDPESMGVGLSLGFGDFKIGGSYMELDGGLVSDGEAYDIGVSFANGPATYSLTYFNGEGVGGASERSTVVLAARYAVSSNFAVGVSISDTTSDVAGVEMFDGQLLALGASFSF